MTQQMSYFLIITDNNGRQYLHEVKETGIPVYTNKNHSLVTINNPNLDFFIECLNKNITFAVNNCDVFNPSNITAVQLKALPTEEIN